MYDEAKQLADLLRNNSDVTCAYLDHGPRGAILHVHIGAPARCSALKLPAGMTTYQIIWHPPTYLRDLRSRDTYASPQNPHQTCQNEPIRLGCQIQPQGAPWVGTAGAPIKWTDAHGETHWGILSNWHVLTAGRYTIDHPVHQPTDDKPAVAHLTDYSAVLPNADNTIDAAVADAMVGGYHTIADQLVGLGKIDPIPAAPCVGCSVAKSGRTTGVTYGTLLTADAAVRVDYGDFTATLVHQLLITNPAAPFAQPGDSGSLVIHEKRKAPLGLLFAGDQQYTAANRIENVLDRFHASFQL